MEDESPVSAAAVAKLAGAQRQQQQQRRQRREALEQKRDAMEQENDEDEEEEAVEDAQAPPPAFPPLPQRDAAAGGESNFARINVPPHRLTPLRENWMGICTPVAEQMKLLIRYNVEKKCVEMKTSEHTTVPNALQKASDFVRAFLLGFELRDAIAMLRIDDLYIDSFEVKDGTSARAGALSARRFAGADASARTLQSRL
jgi:RNA-binding protein PNO1